MPQKSTAIETSSWKTSPFKPQAQRLFVGKFQQGSGRTGTLCTTVATGMRPRLELGLV